MELTEKNATGIFPDGITLELLEQFPLGIIIFNEEGKIQYCNQNTFQFGVLYESSPEALKGKSINDIKFIRSPEITTEIGSILNGNSFESEIKNLPSGNNFEISIIIKGVPINQDGVLKGGILIIEDLRISSISDKHRSGKEDALYDKLSGLLWEMYLIVDHGGKIIYSGGKNLKKFTETAGKKDMLSTFIKPKIASKLLNSFRGVQIKGMPDEFILEIPVEETLNELEYFECFVMPISNEPVRLLYFIGMREITIFLKMIENQKRELSELQTYYSFTQHMDEGLVAINDKSKIIFWNRAAEKIFLFRRSEVYGKNLWKIIPALSEELISKLKKEPSFEQIISFSTPASETKTLKYSARKIENEEGHESLLLFFKDITKEHQQYQQLLLDSAYFRAGLDNNSGIACRLNKNGEVSEPNKAFVTAFGQINLNRNTLYFFDLVDPKFVVENDLTWQSLRNGKSFPIELPLQTKEGEVRVFSVILFNIPEDKNNFGLIGYDVTQEAKSRKEIFMLRSIFNFSNDGIAVECDGKFILANEAFAKLYGYESAEHLIGVESLKIVSEEEQKRVADYTALRKQKKDIPTRYEFLAQRKNGSKFYAEVSVTTFSTDTNDFLIIVARDISEHKRTQQAIKESEERYRSITENIDDFFFTAERINNKLKTIFFTTSVEKITGYTQIELLEDQKFFFRIIYPDDFRMVKQKLKNFFQNSYKNSESFEFRLINKNGNIVWVRNKLTVLRNRKGEITKAFGLVSDISLQKKAEEDLHLSAQKLKKLNETKDRFISIISHDLRTPFSSILGFTDLLLSDDDLSPEDRKQYISYIQESSKNMLGLVNSLLDWTRLQTGRINFEPVRFELFDIAQRAISSLSGFAIQKNITLKNEINSEFVVFVDSNLISQVFNNLLSNALKFTPGGGTITITAKQADQPRFIEVSVTDTGVGIKPENISKVFNIDSKFTTDGTSGEKGTGLGLSLVREIVERHGGKINVESTVGKGTRFFFTLPKASASILIIEDNTTDRILYSKLLKSFVMDFDIISASNGKQGLEMLKIHSPALIITDHMMPIMNGLEFVKAYRELPIKGKPPVMILSGDIGKSEILAYTDMGIEYIFQKPVNIASFKEAVEKSLKQLPGS